MLANLANGLLLMAVCVVIHAAGMIAALRWGPRRSESYPRYLHWTGMFIGLAAWLILLHLLEITTWGIFFFWKEALPDLQSALYFSTVTYTTTGYGDIVLPRDSRLLGGVEALTGILMSGWSTGLFFAFVTRLFVADAGARRDA